MSDVTPDSGGNRVLTFAYYCSGHGYGHATRVSAFARHLLTLSPKPVVYIVSSAPEHVFSDSISSGAIYRNAHIDPVIVQPLAYRVDREESVKALRRFLRRKSDMIEEESRWLRSVNADCVLSDAAFLGCAAANAAGVPSVLITNFTFDAVFSYLSTPLVDTSAPHTHDQWHQTLSPLAAQLPPDVPIAISELAPLVEEVWQGYRCADRLLRLPGAIPIPSFFAQPTLPSPDWIDPGTRQFTLQAMAHLLQDPSEHTLQSQIPFPPQYPPKTVPRSVTSAPLLVRSPNPSIYTTEGRDRLLETIGVPSRVRGSATMKVLIVSFGGQIFHKPHSPSRTHSRSSSCPGTPDRSVLAPSKIPNVAAHSIGEERSSSKHIVPTDSEKALEALSTAFRDNLAEPRRRRGTLSQVVTQGSQSQSILMVPGAPPASIPNSPVSSTLPTFSSIIIPPTPQLKQIDVFSADPEDAVEDEANILPDESWIAIVCGVPKDWAHEDGNELPESFFVAPKDVYMPDLTAVADVLLGKLGYGTVSECVDACTPFVYVPRPLFIEEHGLRLFLDREGVGVELSRDAYEAGDWAAAIQEAYDKGRDGKAAKRQEGDTGRLAAAGREMAANLVSWVTSYR